MRGCLERLEIENKNRNLVNVVYLRSILCILVVVGHVVGRWKMTDKFFVPVYSSHILGILADFINSFHMSLFFALSGFVYCYCLQKKKYYKDTWKVIASKFKRLIVPFIVTVLLFTPVIWYTTDREKAISSILKNFITGVNGYHLWYLPATFYIFVLMTGLNKILDKGCIWSAIMMLTLSFFLSCYYFMIPIGFYVRDAAVYLFFFLGGYLVEMYADKLNAEFFGGGHTRRNIVIILLLTIFVIGIFRFDGIVEKRIKAVCIDVCVVIALIMLNKRIEKMKKILYIIDKNSMAIYLFHPIIMYLFFYYYIDLNCSPFLLAAVGIIVCITCSIGIAILFRKLGMNVFLGEFSETNN